MDKNSINYSDSDIYKLDILSILIAYIVSFFFIVRDFFVFFDKGLHIVFLITISAWIFYSNTVVDNIFHNRRIRYLLVADNFIKIFSLTLITVLAYSAIFELSKAKYFIYSGFIWLLIIGLINRLIYVNIIRQKRKGGADLKTIAIVGVNEFTISFAKEISEHPEYGYRVMGFFDYDPEQKNKKDNLLLMDQLYKFLIKKRIDEVYISTPIYNDYYIKGLSRYCYINEIKVSFINEFIYYINRKFAQLEIDYHGPTPIISIKEESLDRRVGMVSKRIFDILGAVIAIVFIMSWLYPIIAILIKLDSRGPVLFKQLRSGINNKPFYCFKFRTMVVNKEADNKQAEKNDPRITKIGAFLRKTSLDELPQIFNVLIGDMSIVGPRPHMLQHTKAYSKLIDSFMIRHWIKPGITGLAQAKGFRGETKDLSQMHNRVHMDLLYLRNWSLWLDFKIFVSTIWGIISQKNKGF